MSIYATLWNIKLEDRAKQAWVEVWAQGVPPHIGQPEEGYDTDPYADFLPPLVADYKADDAPYRAVVFVRSDQSEKDGQRYVSPLLTITGKRYRKIAFPVLLSLLYRAILKK